ncbi:MAG: hypothetical protein C0608_06040 [Deltaproteobacteria bacterium]|nr:MAG: hypothetical protein C0608_06040 [Deltaproteobacteria bacterium]
MKANCFGTVKLVYNREEMNFNRILIFQTAFLGDVVLTTPLFRAVKRLYPQAHLTLLTTPAAKPLVEENPHLDEIITFDKKGGEAMTSIISRVRKGRYDLLLSPHRSHRTSIIAMLSGIKVRVGYREAGFPLAYNRRVSRPMELHEVDRILALLTPLGVKVEESDRELYAGYTWEERELVDSLLKEAGFAPGEKILGLAPGSVWATKRWRAEGFAEVAKKLKGRGYRIVIIGGPDDVETACAVEELIGEGVLNAAGKTPLKALPAWLDSFSLFVTNDSSPLHVAAARRIPTVAIFGATVRELGFYPFHENSRLVEHDLPCRPCGLHGGDKCPEGHFDCMGLITPEAVLSALEELEGVR